MAWLVREGNVLATAEVAKTRAACLHGLRGRNEFSGALVINPCRAIHTIGVQFPIDVAWVAKDGTVLRMRTIKPLRISMIIPRARFVVEAESGAFERWELSPGDVIELKE